MSTENASRPVQVVESIIQSEMQQFQDRLHRCVKDCEDSAKDRYPDLGTNSSSMQKAQQFALSCTSSCVDKHVALLKPLQLKLEAEIDRATGSK